MALDTTCDRSNINGTGSPLERRFWLNAEYLCTCPSDLVVSATVNGEVLNMRAKQCSLWMQRQNLTLKIFSPVHDFPAYTAFEVDRGTYGHSLKRIFHAAGTTPAFVDIGANLGILSMALALASPSVRGVAYEPNPATYAFLQRNIEANNLAARVHEVNAGISSDGRVIQMPRCVVASETGSQMASTQWTGVDGRTPMQVCFSGLCKAKMRSVSECMRERVSVCVSE